MAEWRYLPDGKVRHALYRSTDAVAVCGVGVWVASAWLGTGSQVEYERCAELRACRRCVAKVGHR